MELKEGRIGFLTSEEGCEITISDGISGCTILEVKLTPVQLSQMLSRLYNTHCDITFNDRAHLIANKQKIFENLQVEVTGIPHDLKKEKAIELAKIEMLKKKGWLLNDYLGSQNSFVKERNSGKEFANFTIYKYD